MLEQCHIQKSKGPEKQNELVHIMKTYLGVRLTKQDDYFTTGDGLKPKDQLNGPRYGSQPSGGRKDRKQTRMFPCRVQACGAKSVLTQSGTPDDNLINTVYLQNVVKWHL